MIFAVIKDGLVFNTIVADSKTVAEQVSGLECIEISGEPGSPVIGWSYDGNSFSAPVIEISSEEPTE